MGNIIEEKYTNEYEVWTENGWKNFSGIGKTEEYDIYELVTENKSLKCADDHLIKTDTGFKKLIHLNNDDLISTEDGYEKVKNIIRHFNSDNMYDLMDVDGGEYLTNGITSHNTTLVAAYILWYSIFNSHKTIGIVSNKERSAKDILKRLKGMYEDLPSWMKCGVELYNITGILFDNDTEIMVAATSPDAFRGKALNILFCMGGENTVTVRDMETKEIKELSIKELYKDLLIDE